MGESQRSRMKINTLLVRLLKRRPPPEPTVEEVLSPLAEPFRSTRVSMYRAESLEGSDGQQHPVDNHTRISPSQGMWLCDQGRSMEPGSTLDVGFAYGFSAVFFLAAIAANRAGRHTAVDPFERSAWHGIGLATVHAITADSWFRFIEERSDRASTDLARENATFDIIFIDGNHRLDDALVDFYLYAPLSKIEGLIIFDDMWMNSIQTVASFVRTNRPDFSEVATNLPNVAVFRRIGEDLRRWDDFHPFFVAGNGQTGR
jgi:predicted O-methyltransferase YrrM